MNLAPGWAPNIHPLLVHFPIGLLCAAAAVDVVGWLFRRNRLLRQAATVLYVLGTGGAIAAYVTGRAASQTIWLPGMAQAVHPRQDLLAALGQDGQSGKGQDCQTRQANHHVGHQRRP